jgi:hypothetical protein
VKGREKKRVGFSPPWLGSNKMDLSRRTANGGDELWAVAPLALAQITGTDLKKRDWQTRRKRLVCVRPRTAPNALAGAAEGGAHTAAEAHD